MAWNPYRCLRVLFNWLFGQSIFGKSVICSFGIVQLDLFSCPLSSPPTTMSTNVLFFTFPASTTFIYRSTRLIATSTIQTLSRLLPNPEADCAFSRSASVTSHIPLLFFITAYQNAHFGVLLRRSLPQKNSLCFNGILNLRHEVQRRSYKSLFVIIVIFFIII